MLIHWQSASSHASTGPVRTIIIHDHFGLKWLVDLVSIAASRVASRPTSIHPRVRMDHHAVGAHGSTCTHWTNHIRHRTLLLDLVRFGLPILDLIIVAWHWPAVAYAHLSSLRLRMRPFTVLICQNAWVHTLTIWSIHIQAILIVVNHTLCMSFAWCTELVLVISAVASILIDNSTVLRILIISNRFDEIIILRDNVVITATSSSLQPTWLVPLALSTGVAAIWNARICALPLVDALHILGYNIILGCLRLMLGLHLTLRVLGVQVATRLLFTSFWCHTKLLRHASIKRVVVLILRHLLKISRDSSAASWVVRIVDSANVVQANLAVMKHLGALPLIYSRLVLSIVRIG